MPQKLDGTFHCYQPIRKLGQGAFGEVILARVVETGQVVALKRIPIRNTDGLPDNVAREMRSLQAVQHVNVVSLLDVFAQGQAVYLALEYCVSDLGTLVRTACEPIPEAVVKGLLQQLLRGLLATHAAGVLHRDVKPSNVLLTHTGTVKLADYGLARPIAPDHLQRPTYTHTVATRWYRAPELLYGARCYSEAVDMWGVALVFAEMLKLAPLLPGENDIDQLGRVIHAFGSMEDAWPDVSQLPDWGKVSFPSVQPQPLSTLLPGQSVVALDLLAKMTRYDPSQRITAAQALADPFFSQLPPPASEACVSRWVQSVTQPLSLDPALQFMP